MNRYHNQLELLLHLQLKKQKKDVRIIYFKKKDQEIKMNKLILFIFMEKKLLFKKHQNHQILFGKILKSHLGRDASDHL